MRERLRNYCIKAGKTDAKVWSGTEQKVQLKDIIVYTLAPAAIEATRTETETLRHH